MINYSQHMMSSKVRLPMDLRLSSGMFSHGHDAGLEPSPCIIKQSVPLRCMPSTQSGTDALCLGASLSVRRPLVCMPPSGPQRNFRDAQEIIASCYPLVPSCWAGNTNHLLKVQLRGRRDLISLGGEQRRRHHLYSAGLYWMLGHLQQPKVLALPCTASS